MYHIHFYDDEGLGVYENITEDLIEAYKATIQARGGVVTAVIKVS